MPKYRYVFVHEVEADDEFQAAFQVASELTDEADSPQVIANSLEEVVDDGEPRCQRCGSRLY